MSVPNKSKSRLVEQTSASARRIPSSDITDLPWPTNDRSRVCHFVYKNCERSIVHAKGLDGEPCETGSKARMLKEEKRCILEKKKEKKER